MNRREIMIKMEAKTRELLAKAGELTGYQREVRNVKIHFDLRGRTAGQVCIVGDQIIIRYNLVACELYWDDSYNDTIPHEVAHVIGFIDDSICWAHNKGWKELCIRLGGSGERCHTLDLPKARKTKKHVYVLDDGSKWITGTVRHNRIQRGYPYILQKKYTNSGAKMDIRKHHYIGLK